jgi:hypothetical protein
VQWMIPKVLRYLLCSRNQPLNPLNAELNPTCHLLALLRGATIVVITRLRVKSTDEQQVHYNFEKLNKELGKFYMKLQKQSRLDVKIK